MKKICKHRIPIYLHIFCNSKFSYIVLVATNFKGTWYKMIRKYKVLWPCNIIFNCSKGLGYSPTYNEMFFFLFCSGGLTHRPWFLHSPCIFHGKWSQASNWKKRLEVQFVWATLQASHSVTILSAMLSYCVAFNEKRREKINLFLHHRALNLNQPLPDATLTLSCSQDVFTRNKKLLNFYEFSTKNDHSHWLRIRASLFGKACESSLSFMIFLDYFQIKKEKSYCYSSWH